jgi:hypothetical protein
VAISGDVCGTQTFFSYHKVRFAMSKYIFTFAFIALLAVVGCQKKDEGGGAAAPGCGPAQVMSPYYNRCLSQASCPQGLAQNPDQPTMCINIATGVNQMTQRCGVGYFLTTSGCLPQGLCPSGQAARGDVCVAVVAGGSAFQDPQSQYQQQQTYPQYNYQNQYQQQNQYGGYPSYFYGRSY